MENTDEFLEENKKIENDLEIEKNSEEFENEDLQNLEAENINTKKEEEKNETFASDSEYMDQRSLILKEYLKKYIIPGIDNDISGETLLTHSGYLNDNDVMIIQWIKHFYLNNDEIKNLLCDEKAICIIVNFADKQMQDLQMNSKDVTQKQMESIMKKSIKYAQKHLGIEKLDLVDYSKMKWYVKLKNKILEYFYKK